MASQRASTGLAGGARVGVELTVADRTAALVAATLQCREAARQVFEPAGEVGTSRPGEPQLRATAGLVADRQRAAIGVDVAAGGTDLGQDPGLQRRFARHRA